MTLERDQSFPIGRMRMKKDDSDIDNKKISLQLREGKKRAGRNVKIFLT